MSFSLDGWVTLSGEALRHGLRAHATSALRVSPEIWPRKIFRKDVDGVDHWTFPMVFYVNPIYSIFIPSLSYRCSRFCVFFVGVNPLKRGWCHPGQEDWHLSCSTGGFWPCRWETWTTREFLGKKRAIPGHQNCKVSTSSDEMKFNAHSRGKVGVG